MTVAVLVMLAAAAAVTVQAIVRLALPLAAMVIPVHVPVPVAPEAMVPTVKVPPEGVKEQPLSPAGSAPTIESVLLGSITLGPALLTLRV